MTNMKRVTISLPEEYDRRILALRKNDEFIRCSYSEIVRKILERGMEDVFENRQGQTERRVGEIGVEKREI